MSNLTPEDILGGKPQKSTPWRATTRTGVDPTYYQYETQMRKPQGRGGWEFANDFPSTKAAIRELKEGAPYLFRAFFPRIYNSVDRYADWRWAHVVAAAHVQVAHLDAEYVEAYEAERNALTFSLLWKQHGLTSFFVSSPLFNAAAQTTPPAELDFTDFKMPFEAMNFILPKGAMKFRGEDVDFIGFARLKKGDYTLSVDPNMASISVQLNDNKYIISTAVRGAALHFGVGFYERGFKQILTEGAKGMVSDAYFGVGTEQKPRTEYLMDDANFIFQCFYIVLNLTLAMGARPELIERGRRITLHKKDRLTEVWSPNQLGLKYRVVYSGGVPAGTHASPRAHWRRGHWRNQGIGRRIPVHCLCGCRHDTHPNKEECLTPDCRCFKYRPVGGGYAEHILKWIDPIWVQPAE